MPELINPTTNRSFNQDKVLLELQRWTLDTTVIKAMWTEKLATPDQLERLAIRVAATLRPHDEGLAALSNPLTPRETAILALQFLGNRIVRQQIAKVVAKQQKISKAEAMKGLWETREFLLSNYNIEGKKAAEAAGLVMVE